MRVEPKSTRIVREAKEAGRVVTASLKWHKYLSGDAGADSLYKRRAKYWVTYVYEVDGKAYKYRRTIRNTPPETIELYYPEDHPEKAIAEGESILGFQYVFVCSIPLIIAVVLYHLVFKHMAMPEIDIVGILPLVVGGVFILFIAICAIALLFNHKRDK